MHQAGEQTRDGFVQLGNSLDQVTDTAARAYGAYAQGYSQAYQSYQGYQAQPQMQGTIISPDGVSTYWIMETTG